MSNCNKNNVMPGELMTVQEVATYFRVSRVTVWRWCQKGLIPAFQIGRNWRVRRTDLLNLEEHLIAGPVRIDGDVSMPTFTPSKVTVQPPDNWSQKPNSKYLI